MSGKHLRDLSKKASAALLTTGVVAGFAALLWQLGSFYWFHGDEWVFLTRRLTGSLLEPHNEHLAVIPILVYRWLFGIWSIESYTPYQIPVVTLHLATAVLLWLVMRRSGVNTWIATGLTLVFIFYGPGEENIIWAFQVGFTGAMALGLGQLVLADHTGSAIDRRDAAGLLAGFLALLSAGFTPVLVAVTGAVALLRRGWFPALFHTVPLAVIYLTWWLAVGPATISDPYGRDASLGAVLHFVYTGYKGMFLGLAGSSILALLYCAVLLSGLALTCVRHPAKVLRQRYLSPAGLLGAGIVLLCVTGYGRWWINDSAGAQSRYLHLITALTLPAFGVAVDALTRLWKPSRVLAVLLIVSVIPANIEQFGNQPLFNKQYFENRKRNFVSLAHSPYAEQVPRDTRPDPIKLNVPIGWILDRRGEGALPDASPRRNRADPLLFGLSQLEEDNPFSHCMTVRGPLDLALQRGDELGVEIGPWTRPKPGWYVNQSFTVQLLKDGQPVGRPQMRHPGVGNLLRVEIDALEVRFDLAGETEAFILCTEEPLPK